jgi:hypothetical protein
MGLAIFLKKPDPNASRDDRRKRKDGENKRVNNENYENTLVSDLFAAPRQGGLARANQYFLFILFFKSAER